MTRRDEVLTMARAAGLQRTNPGEAIEVVRFAAMVAAAEREQCAKVGEAIRDDYAATGSNLQACAADYIACNIRALKEEVSE